MHKTEFKEVHMKAKEYAERLKQTHDLPVSIFGVIKDILIESEAIVKARHIKRTSSLLEVFDELEKKWLAVVRHSELRFKNDPKEPFRFVFKKLMPMIYDEWELHNFKNKRVL